MGNGWLPALRRRPSANYYASAGDLFMYHDQVTGKRLRSTHDHDQRDRPRVPYPAELVIAWHCNMPSTTRYAVVDVGDGGFRIRSALPLIKGMTGTAVTLLPEGHEIGQPVMVVWCRENSNQDGYEVGLRRF